MRSSWLGVAILLIIIGWFVGSKSVAVEQPATMPDISWPNCTLNIGHSELGIVGIDDGLALRPNPCLAKEAGDFSHLSVYVNTGYPGSSYSLKFKNYPRHCSVADPACLAYNYGFNSGLYDINYSLSQGVIASRWWLDVETDNSWSTNLGVNRQALQGTLDALSSFVGNDSLGFYSASAQWQAIVGNWRPDYPAWLGTGATVRSVAAQDCRATSFTGEPILLSQYTPSLDADLFCAGYSN